MEALPWLKISPRKGWIHMLHNPASFIQHPGVPTDHLSDLLSHTAGILKR
jgi:hypothetical protein